MNIRFAALALAALVAFTPAAYAKGNLVNPGIQEVSKDVDVALWCGSAYVVASQMGGLDDQSSAKANQFAEVAFGKATNAMQSQGVTTEDHDRIVSLYLEEAIRGLQGTVNDLRYNDQACVQLVGSL